MHHEYVAAAAATGNDLSQIAETLSRNGALHRSDTETIVTCACGIRSSCVEYGYSWVNNTIPGCYCLRIHVIDMVDSAYQEKEH